jgi:hypothetical protein
MEEPGNLDGHFLAPFRWSGNQRRVGGVVCHGNGDAAEQLNAFGDLVNEVVLRRVVFVEQKVQLIERRSCRLPVVLLKQVAQWDRVGEQLIEIAAD